jgi:hypothetical protein
MNPTANAELYERDFNEWVQHNVDLLLRGRTAEADLAHLADELEKLANYEQRAIKKRLVALVADLLKWKYQSEKRYSRSGKSFLLSRILGRRWRLKLILKQSPSLKRYAASALAANYHHAAKQAVIQTGIPIGQFPAECPFTLDQVLDDEFLPD